MNQDLQYEHWYKVQSLVTSALSEIHHPSPNLLEIQNLTLEIQVKLSKRVNQDSQAPLVFLRLIFHLTCRR